MKDDKNFAIFLENLCSSCHACPNLISLEAGPDECDKCSIKQSLKRPLRKSESPPPAQHKRRSLSSEEKTDGSGTVHSSDSPELSMGKKSILN